ncbi:unnamed protein product [Rhizoctonia solani]|uniref:VWFA domain-containing protein n=1 Tax=Rhizoctonia solani TaxID=456999 RepID=A0A8H3GR47_9AGAM|nr:unnamed protein product [Rhizoctonia solani]
MLLPPSMTYQSKPTADGVYLIKVLSKDLFVEGVSGDKPKLQLAAPSSNDNQKWNLAQVPGKVGVWKMTCVDGSMGIAHAADRKLYWGYGHPYPHSGDSQEWNFIERDQKFSKIKLNDGTDCFDACDSGSNTVRAHIICDKKLTNMMVFALRSTSTRIKGMLGPYQCYVFELLLPVETPQKALDVLFLQDFTGSQGSYIDQSRREINEVCNSLLRLNEGELVAEDLRFGLIAFRDHPPQDKTFVSKIFDFTSDASIMASYLGSLTVGGGGDGPEAQCDALFDALHSPWNERATKVAVLVTDAPPHGLGESDDGFPDGCPCGHDPLQIADGMLSSGITLVCPSEPPFQNLLMSETVCDRMRTHIEHQLSIYNLGNPSGLTDVIVGCLLQATDSDTLVARHRAAIRRDAASGALSPEEIARTLHEDLSNANVSHYGLSLDAMVELNEEGERNIQEWYDATSMIAARENIREAPPNRIKPEYLSGSSPAASMGRRPITLAQVEGIVRRSLSRRH